MVIFTSSPRTAEGNLTPMPKSVRLMVVEASKPTCFLWSMPETGAVGPSTVSTTGLVTPCRVRLPATLSVPSAFLLTLEEVKVAEGLVSTPKK